MFYLACDTSSSVNTLALYEGSDFCGELTFETSKNHTENFFLNLDFFLGRFELNVSQIDHFIIGGGPGSFTGLRIGFSVMKALAWQNKKIFSQVSTLKGLAFNLKNSNAPIAVIIKTVNQEYFAGFYAFRKGKFEVIFDDALLSAEEILSRIPEGSILVGKVDPDLINAPVTKDKKVTIVKGKLNFIQASGLIEALLNGFVINTVFPEEAGQLFSQEPNYLKKSYAEINRDKEISKNEGRSF